MAFLFKSKKNQDRALSSRDGNITPQGGMNSAGNRMTRDEKNLLHHRATPTGSVNSIENDNSGVNSPDFGHKRGGGSLDQTLQSSNGPGGDMTLRNGPPLQNPNASLYPWYQRRMTYTTSQPSPFPRYGAAVNGVSSKEGDIYLMGGLINSSTVKGDLWMIEAGGNMTCYPLATTAEGPGPRVGHASLLVGNAFIVYGGDTKIDDSDVLDETLYLLNTSTRHWSRALPSGPRPSGRYGHSLNILGSKIFIFGGQVEGYFMNDLAAFDLNQLQMATNRWEVLISSEVSPNIPAARTNHTIVTYNDKMYLFGGTNGFQWFNDVWCYDPAINKWAQLDCIGYIPAAREGHAAAIVDDVMYVFGGRTEEGTDLGDLAAFRISLRRWYTFQNMGPSPSPRSGHSMTTVGKSIVVLGGEPSSTTTTTNDLGILYVLDTTKIRYPVDGQQNTLRNAQGGRPSLESGVKQQSPRDSPNATPDARRLMTSPTPNANANASPSSLRQAPAPDAAESTVQPSPYNTNGPTVAVAAAAAAPVAASALRSTPVGPAGPPPQGPTPAKPTTDSSGQQIRPIGPANDATIVAGSSPQIGSGQSPVTRSVDGDVVNSNSPRTPTQAARAIKPDIVKHARQGPSQGSIEASDSALKLGTLARPASPPPPNRQSNSNPLSRRSSGRNSQTVALLKELDSLRNKSAWYASELELARKAGYSANPSSSPALDVKSTATFDDEDRPLIEALLAMRTELANVQSAVDKQAVVAARQIAEAEKQRDAAIQEAVYAKAKFAAQSGGSASSTPQLDGGGERDDLSGRSDEVSKKFASALHLQKDLQSRMTSVKSELEAEKRARQLADETSNAAERRLAELESYKQQSLVDLEQLKSELHLSQKEAREHSTAGSEAVAALALLKVERDEISNKYNEAVGGSKSHDETFESIRSAMRASEDAKSHLEKKLGEERSLREKTEAKLSKLKVEHEARTAELVASTQRLRDTEELAEKHATEARTHRQAVLSGLDKITTRDIPKASNADADRIVVLQNQVNTSTALAKKYQLELNTAADKLRSAEERIAGLEQYQEQSSREGVSIRRQLQAAMRETQGLQAAHSDVRNQLAAQQLETNAMTVQHTALKDILAERGISPTGAVHARARGLAGSPRMLSPEQGRLRDLETQLSGAHSAHEETKQMFAAQAQESESAYREKLTQLESDYQSAVHYVKGTEKMLKQLKDQLSRYKTENSRLKEEIEELEQTQQAEGERSVAITEWQTERAGLQKQVSSLQEELQSSGLLLEKKLAGIQTELTQSKKERDLAIKEHDTASQQFKSQLKDLEQLHSENAQLEQRAMDAEQKVSLLLDQVENSVDSYRRRSRQVAPSTDVTNGAALGHARKESVEVESLYSANGVDARNSVALDNLASELETLRSHWEATNKNYRLSTNFDFDPPAVDHKKQGESVANSGLSESLADWRKKLDAEEHGDKSK